MYGALAIILTASRTVQLESLDIFIFIYLNCLLYSVEVKRIYKLIEIVGFSRDNRGRFDSRQSIKRRNNISAFSSSLRYGKLKIDSY